MEEKDVQEFNLDDIMKEFAGDPDPAEDTTVTDDTVAFSVPEKVTENAVSSDTVVIPQVTDDTVRVGAVSDDTIRVCAVTDDTIRVGAVTDDTIRVGAVTDDTIRVGAVADDTIRVGAVADDTIRVGAVSSDTVRIPDVGEKHAQSQTGADTIRFEGIENAPEENQAADPFTASWEPEYDQPIGDYVPPQPMVFHPKSRLRELKRKLVAGPEKQYYKLSEKGMGKLQLAIFLSFVVTLIAAASTAMYALGLVPENRLKLMVFSQVLAMMVSALLGSFQLIEGVAVLGKGRVTLNTLLVITFLVCGFDGVLCLQDPSRIPCCAAFSLLMTFSLWGAYQERHARLGQLDTMRRANHLDGICVQEDYYEGRKGLLRCEGQVEDFMDHYEEVGKPEKRMDWYAIGALAMCLCIGTTAGVLYGVRQGVQVTAVSLLAAVPATAFITISRPFAILVKKLHRLGAVLCGWKAVYAMSGKTAFPLTHEDLFPSGTVKMNGVKFYGSRQPDQIVEYTTALIQADGSGLAPLFVQLLESRNGRHYEVQELRGYHGGIGGIVEDEPVLIGSLPFLKEMGVEVPEGVHVNQALYVAVDGELAGLFALNYDKDRASAAGLLTLCGYRGLKSVLTAGDFMLTESFLRSKFGVKTRKMILPEREVRQELAQKAQEPEGQAQLLVTSEGLAPFAYGVAGARSLRTACNVGTIIHMVGGILGMGIMLALTLLGALEYIEPVNLFLYQLVWIIPGLLITEWTRSI